MPQRIFCVILVDAGPFYHFFSAYVYSVPFAVHLCGMIEKPDILFWHHVDVGFQGRQPL